MSEKPDISRSDLTTTIHLSSLKALSPHVASIIENLSSEDRNVLGQLPIGSGMLVVATGPAKGSRFLIDKPSTTIGRNVDSDILLNDVTVSRKHAIVEMTSQNEKVGRTFVLKDLGSLNGTYIDGIQRDHGALTNGNEIHIGKFKLIFFANNGELSNILHKGNLTKGEKK